MVSLHTEREATLPKRPTLISPKPHINTHEHMRALLLTRCPSVNWNSAHTDLKFSEFIPKNPPKDKKIQPKMQAGLLLCASPKHAETHPSHELKSTETPLFSWAERRISSLLTSPNGQHGETLSSSVSRHPLCSAWLPPLRTHCSWNSCQTSWPLPTYVACWVLAFLSFWTVRTAAIQFFLLLYQHYWNIETTPPTTTTPLPLSHHEKHLFYWKSHLRQAWEQIIWLCLLMRCLSTALSQH